MPWKPSDAKSKNKNADTPAKQRQWAKTANEVLKSTGDDAKAIRSANAAIKKRGK